MLQLLPFEPLLMLPQPPHRMRQLLPPLSRRLPYAVAVAVADSASIVFAVAATSIDVAATGAACAWAFIIFAASDSRQPMLSLWPLPLLLSLSMRLPRSMLPFFVVATRASRIAFVSLCVFCG